MGYTKDSEEEESMKTYTSLIIDIEKSRAYNVTDRNKIQDLSLIHISEPTRP